MYKYYNKEGQYEMMWYDARYIRINEIRLIREDFLKTK